MLADVDELPVMAADLVIQAPATHGETTRPRRCRYAAASITPPTTRSTPQRPHVAWNVSCSGESFPVGALSSCQKPPRVACMHHKSGSPGVFVVRPGRRSCSEYTSTPSDS